MRAIVEQLAQEGFHTTLGAFRDGLYRARLWRKTYRPLNLPPGDQFSVTSAWLVGEVASRRPQLVDAQTVEAVGHRPALKRAGIGQKPILDALIALWRLDLWTTDAFALTVN